MVVAPLLIYMFMFTLSAWPDLGEHIVRHFRACCCLLVRSPGWARSGACGSTGSVGGKPEIRARCDSKRGPDMTWHLITAEYRHKLAV